MQPRSTSEQKSFSVPPFFFPASFSVPFLFSFAGEVMLRTLVHSIASKRKPFEESTEINAKFIAPDDLGDINNSFYWRELPGFISDNFHSALSRDYPNISLFEKHVGIDRGKQRPHDRYYLSLGNSKYHRTSSITSRFTRKRGSVQLPNLSRSWQLFITKLRSHEYREYVDSILKTSNYDIRFAWHMGFSGAEICPHLDNSLKLGTHIFYFNSEADWDAQWGGQTVILSDLKKESDSPEFEDFAQISQVSNIGNNSLVFRNSPIAWHGVRPLKAPVGKFRKIFTIIFDTPNTSY